MSNRGLIVVVLVLGSGAGGRIAFSTERARPGAGACAMAPRCHPRAPAPPRQSPRSRVTAPAPLSSFSFCSTFSCNFPVPPRRAALDATVDAHVESTWPRRSTWRRGHVASNLRAASASDSPELTPALITLGCTESLSCPPSASQLCPVVMRVVSSLLLCSALIFSSYHYHYQFPRGSPTIRVNC